MNLDTVYGLIPRARFFSGRWGEPDALEFDLPVELAAAAPAVAPRFGRQQRVRDLRVRDASFRSPEPDLPPGAETAHVRWLLPPEREPTRVALVFAAWGEEGYSFRTRLLAPLVRAGLSAMLLELPFYGARRPTGQRGPLIRTVADFVRLGRAATAEARGLLAWLHGDGWGTGVVGFSMGGQLACMVGATMPFGLDIVAIAASSTPAPVFTEGPISRGVAWNVLSRDGKGPARPRLARLMRCLRPQTSRARAGRDGLAAEHASEGGMPRGLVACGAGHHFDSGVRACGKDLHVDGNNELPITLAPQRYSQAGGARRRSDASPASAGTHPGQSLRCSSAAARSRSSNSATSARSSVRTRYTISGSMRS